MLVVSPQELKVYLLRPHPHVILGDEPIEFGGRPLDLFVYLSDTQKDVYAREDLLTKLYGADAQPKALRQNALYYLPTLIKEYYIDSSDPTVIRFHRDKVWVDSQEFVQRA